jgi:hypothetical protein
METNVKWGYDEEQGNRRPYKLDQRVVLHKYVFILCVCCIVAMVILAGASVIDSLLEPLKHMK